MMELLGFRSPLAFWWAMVYPVFTLITLALWIEWRSSKQHHNDEERDVFSARGIQQSLIKGWWRATGMGLVFFCGTTFTDCSLRPTYAIYAADDTRCTVEYYDFGSARYDGQGPPESFYTHPARHEIRRSAHGGQARCSVRTSYNGSRYDGHHVQHLLQMCSLGTTVPAAIFVIAFRSEIGYYNTGYYP